MKMKATTRIRRSGRQAALLGVLTGALLCTAEAMRAQGGMDANGMPKTGTQAPGQGAAQGEGQGGGRRGQYAGMGRVMGEVMAVNGNTLTVKAEDGSTVQVVATDNTRVMKERGPVKLSDLHAGDGLMAVGNLDAATKTLHAGIVMAEDAAQVKAMRENLGKTYITGRVTAIDLDNAKMTVERTDHTSQTIGFDETTSFKRAVRGGSGSGGPGGNGSGGEGSGPGSGAGRGPGSGGAFGGGGMGMGAMALNGGIDRAFSNGESITLADIKVGDFVAGTGAVKGGTFVPVHLLDSPPGQRRQRSGTTPGSQGQGAPGGSGTANPGPGEL
jgi:hypothetical protein